MLSPATLLQWGRVKNHAESAGGLAVAVIGVGVLQWGRVKNHAERLDVYFETDALWTLQWGRVKNHAERAE